MRKFLNKIAGPVLKATGTSKVVFDKIESLKGKKLETLVQSQLVHKIKRENAIDCKLPLFCCLRNEMHRVPFFLKYYRDLGVDHFFFVDNNSNDGFLEYMEQQEDVSVWHTTASYKDSNFGIFWTNYITNTYGTNKWCVTVDPDEFVVYPKIESRNLIELTTFMDEIEQSSLFCLMVDCYSNKSILDSVLTKNDSPFDVCPYFDRYNYVQSINEELGNFWIQGGVRMRCFFKDAPENAPAQNKVSLIKWRPGLKYVSSMHHTNMKDINCTIQHDSRFLSGCLFHFKYVSSLQTKVEEEMIRKQHYGNSKEYKGYDKGGYDSLYDPYWSVKYKDSNQLVKLKFMHRGEWF